MALAGLRPYGATFFVFTDYMRAAIRLSCIMHQPVIYVLTHDSIGLGEDGPTHQPIEHLAALRAMPRMLVMRPGDANEVAEVYRTILPIKDRPACLVLTRQALPTLDRGKFASASGVFTPPARAPVDRLIQPYSRVTASSVEAPVSDRLRLMRTTVSGRMRKLVPSENSTSAEPARAVFT